MKRILLLFVILYVKSHGLLAQNYPFLQEAKLPNFSPNVAAVSRYVEFPVNTFNGMADITLPLYNIVSGDINIPIALSYHADGIKVAEEASWVGLGWSLNCGGVVTHDIKGEDDYSSQTNLLFDKVFPSATAYTHSYSNADMSIPRTGCDHYDQYGNNYNLFNALTDGIYIEDGEPDLFLYNIGGKYSGKYCYINGVVYDLGNNNIKVTQDISGQGIEIITPDGFRYAFNKTERSNTNTYYSTYVISNPQEMVTAFYLTSITSPGGKTVSFEYRTFKEIYQSGNGQGMFYYYTGASDFLPQIPSFSEQYRLPENYPNERLCQDEGESPIYGYTYIRSQTFSTPVYLEKILFDEGYIVFDKIYREDAFGYRLDRIKVYDKSNMLKKEYAFNYGYFTTSDDSKWYVASLNYPDSYCKKRLKLLSVQEGTTQTESKQYTFAYEENYLLPNKTSFSQDYWGYYNGAFANTSLIPDFRRYPPTSQVPALIQNYSGANREPADSAIKACALKKINYPTGGFTEFITGSNQYTNTDGQVPLTNPVFVGVTDVDVGYQTQEFILDQATYVDISGTLFCNTSNDQADNPAWDCGCCFSVGLSPNQNILYVEIQRYDVNSNIWISTNYQWDGCNSSVISGHGAFQQQHVLLAAGRYRLIANYPDVKAPGALGQKMAGIGVSYLTQGAQPNKGGGLRINEISHYDPISMKTIKKSYQYEGGKLMHYPQFHWTEKVNNYGFDPGSGLGMFYCPTYNWHYIYSTPVVPYSYSANGSAVGYAKVTEQLENGEIGKTVFEYWVQADKPIVNIDNNYIKGVPTTPYLENGFLQKTSVFDNNNMPMKVVENIPLQISTATFWPFKFRYTNKLPISSTQSDYCSHLIVDFYPFIKGKVVALQTKEQNYAWHNGIQTMLENNIAYTYNNKGYLAQQALLNSKGQTLTDIYTYPTDYTNVSTGWIQSLKDKNIIDVQIETLQKKNGLASAGRYTEYKSDNAGTFPVKTYSLELSAPANVSTSVPNGNFSTGYQLQTQIEYAGANKPSFIKTKDGLVTKLIWNYELMWPLASLQCYDENKFFYYEGFENVNGNSVYDDSKAGRKSRINGFNASLNGPNGEYIFSYWLKSGNSWQFNSSVVNVSNGSFTINLSGQIDEIRLYPKGTFMTTYTYEPLIGMSSECDANNRFTFYEYDSFGRLKLIRDQDRNILKAFDYKYQQQQ